LKKNVPRSVAARFPEIYQKRARRSCFEFARAPGVRSVEGTFRHVQL
jgi:hypothetical protein